MFIFLVTVAYGLVSRAMSLVHRRRLIHKYVDILTLKLHTMTVADVNFIFFSYFIREIYAIHLLANNSYEMLSLVFSAK